MAAWPNSAGDTSLARAMAAAKEIPSAPTRPSNIHRIPVTAASRSPRVDCSWSSVGSLTHRGNVPLGAKLAAVGRKQRRAPSVGWVMSTVAQSPETPSQAWPPADVLLALSYTSWTGMVARRHVYPEDRLALHLLGSPRAARLLVGNPYRSRVSKLGRAALGSRDAAFPSSPGRHVHEPFRVRRRDPTGLPALTRSLDAYERSLRQAAGRHGLVRPAIVTPHPLVAGFCDLRWAGPVTYYATDDLTAYPPLERWRPAYEAAYERLRHSGRRVAAITAGALERIAPNGPSLVLPNGIDPAEWLDPPPAPAWFAALPGPRLLYVGTLDDRLDVAQIQAAARAFPQGSVVLVGRCPEPGHFRSLRSTLNVTLRSSVPRSEIPAIVAAADVGLIPHVTSPLTDTMSPLKLYEYLAAGVPVAATRLAGIAGVLPARCAFAAGPEDFADAVRGALALGRWNDEDRRAFVRDNSWEVRMEALLDLALAA